LNGIAVDANGNVFITTGSLVRRIGPTGIITIYAGGGASQPGNGGQATNAALVPPGVTAGDQVPVVIDISGQVSPAAVTLR
jgi:hypothetical protein